MNNETCYGIVGLSTVYEYYAYPENIRPRISQLLILPPFQNCGLATRLLQSIYKFYGSNKDVVDITGTYSGGEMILKSRCNISD